MIHTNTIQQQVEAIRTAQADLPAHRRESADHITARLTCERDGHAARDMGRCVRCSDYLIEQPIADPGQVEARASEPEGCPRYSASNGCPLHGETCAPAYRN